MRVQQGAIPDGVFAQSRHNPKQKADARHPDSDRGLDKSALASLDWGASPLFLTAIRRYFT